MTVHFPQSEVDVAFAAARKAIDETGYGNWVSDATLTDLVIKVVRAIEEHRQKAKPT